MNDDPARQDDKVLLGRISGVHGIKGWVKIHSDTDPRDAIFEYQPWLLGSEFEATKLLQGRTQGKYLVAELDGVVDRDSAEALVGKDISIRRDQLPELPDTQHYWLDLIGLNVVGLDGEPVGKIKEMIATGANDVMVVSGDRDRLIPFIQGLYVTRVALDEGQVTVDWDMDF
jgi:16S rRNA processing protein RimM